MKLKTAIEVPETLDGFTEIAMSEALRKCQMGYDEIARSAIHTMFQVLNAKAIQYGDPDYLNRLVTKLGQPE